LVCIAKSNDRTAAVNVNGL